ncbi:DUF885 domain-containing protein [Desertimonas flava]|uniref:DUF885 domain-containing protein n=1 Tax=Desertimonas flava TaxID=2064846 RepID=UPI0013C52695|nr:DUF885 domain-containing protein [Desertimonas flava]
MTSADGAALDRDLALDSRMVDAYLARRPFQAGQLGIAARAPMPPITGEQRSSLADEFKAIRSTAASDSHDDWLTAALIEEIADYEIDSLQAGWPEFTVSPLPEAGIASAILTFLPYAGVASADDRARYVEACAAAAAALDASSDELRKGRAAGRLPVRRLVERSIAQIDAYLATPIADDRFVATFADVDDIVRERLRPALARYRDDLVEVVHATARPDERPGLAHLPGGDEIYPAAVRGYTTLPLTPAECADTGLAEVERLRAEVDTIGQRLGVSGGFDAVRSWMLNDPALRFTNADEILSNASEAMQRAIAVVPEWITDLPAATCEVLPMDPVESRHGVLGHYETAPLDRHRPARYWVNVHDPTSRLRYEAEALAFHESVPGHHIEIATSQERPSPSSFRQIAEILPYTEGWALYCEVLADELGLYSDDIARLGMLSFGLWRACRLVVDTGLHAEGWSRDRAVSYLRDNTMLTAANIDNEVDRYIAHPGSALGYLTGRLAIERLKATRVSDFSSRPQQRVFHTSLLANGPLTLRLLGRAMDDPPEIRRRRAVSVKRKSEAMPPAEEPGT